LGNSWHPKCFVCTNCLNPFSGKCYEHNGRPFCQGCLNLLYAPVCKGCNQVINGPYINALGSLWHQEHFVCYSCKRIFQNGIFYEIGGVPYCEQHYQIQKKNNTTKK